METGDLNTPLAAYGIDPASSVDDFFRDEPGIIAVFDYDYEKVVAFYRKLRWAQFVFIPPAWALIPFGYPCFINQNIDWDYRNKHVALTVDGIKFVHEKRPSCWGLHCCDRGRHSKTVPYDKITDCDVEEPAGTACCCCINNVLPKVRIDTASSGVRDGLAVHELEIEGLFHPQKFKQAVWAIKRSNAPEKPRGGAEVLAPPKQADMNTPLLAEIRDELRKLNGIMEAKYGSG
mmetsp:Transcript_21730/g.61020  ORF Transcript_21730/g.61020 Transcript_21730/m.61020 type:complete len:233 (+) Transcript_21730:119-817(+)